LQALALEQDWRNLKEIYDFPIDQVEYLINYSPRFSYVFVETPKAGCSTIKRKLQSMEVDGDRSLLPESVHDKAGSPLKSPAETGLPDHVLLRDGDFFRFCFVRNPYSRVLSAYLDKIVENEWERVRLAPTLNLSGDTIVDFETFLRAVAEQPDGQRDIHWRSQVGILRPDHIRYDYVGRFEILGPSLRRAVSRITGDRAGEIEPMAFHATSASRRAQQYIGETEAELIRAIYAADFAAFGYSRDPYFAAY
jgi:hypothetical protein